MNESQKSQTSRGRRPQRGRRRGKKPEGLNAVQALKQAAPVPVSGPADEPLTAEEVRRMKATFEFLREHRNTLKLRVNAVEDLLLNGKREPSHRGVCQHLLAKVDKDKVLGASERMAPGKATELLAGVIRFAPNLAYVMRFLECVKASAGQEQATAALTQALGSIDFEGASDAQIRHILALIVDIFPAKEQPVFLLSLLRGSVFRKAFDRSTEGLPEPLAKILVPLRAVHQLLVASGKRGRGSRRGAKGADPAMLREGALLLMRVNQKSLLEFSEPVRRRLFQLLCDSSSAEEDIPRDALLSLFKSLHFSNSSERSKSLLLFVGLLLRVGLEKDARAFLKSEIEGERRQAQKRAKAERGNQGSASGKGEQRGEGPNRLEAFLALLNEARVGPIAIEPVPGGAVPEGKGRVKRAPKGRWLSGVHLQSSKALRVLLIEAKEGVDWASSLRIWKSTLIPQVLLPLVSESGSDSGQDFVAVERLASSFVRCLEGANPSQCEGFLLELCRLDSALMAAGVGLPDAKLNRFAVDAAGSLWLADLSGARCIVAGSESLPTRLPETLIEMADIAPGFSLLEAEKAALLGAKTALEVAEMLGVLPE